MTHENEHIVIASSLHSRRSGPAVRRAVPHAEPGFVNESQPCGRSGMHGNPRQAAGPLRRPAGRYRAAQRPCRRLRAHRSGQPSRHCSLSPGRAEAARKIMMILIVERGSGFSVQADVVTQRRTPCLLESLTQQTKLVLAGVDRTGSNA